MANFGTGTSTIGTPFFTPTVYTATDFFGALTLQKNVTLQGGNTDRTSFNGTITSTGPVNITVTSASGSPGERTAFGPGANPVNTFTGTINIVGNGTRFQAGGGASTTRVIPTTVSVTGRGDLPARHAAPTIDGLSGSGKVTIVAVSPQPMVGSTSHASGVIQDGSGPITLAKVGAAPRR